MATVSCGKDKISNLENKLYATSISKPELTVFEVPQESPINETYSVFVRYKGGDWIDLHEFDAEVDGGYLKKPIYHMAFVSFESDFSKTIELKVIKNDGNISGAKIRPKKSNITPVVEGNTITFSINSPQKLSLEINDDLHNNLMVFANNLEQNVVDENDPNVKYFGPGIHKIGGDGKGVLFLKSNESVYIAGGAIVYGAIKAFNTDNISISGRGILCGSLYTDHACPHSDGKGLIEINNSRHVNINGIILLNTVLWNVTLKNCSEVVCDNLKIMGWTINSDGIDPVISNNVIIKDCFVRNYDDCVSIKLDYGLGNSTNSNGSQNITIQDCIFWTDQGRAVLIGPESYSISDKNYNNITIKNLDVLYCKNYDVDWAKGVLAINLGDDATVKSVTFEDVRVEKIGNKTNLIAISIFQSPFNISPGQKIQDIRFNRVTLNSNLNIDNYINGYDQSRIVSGVYFTDLKINNSYINDAKSGGFRINDYAVDIRFN